MRQPKRALSGFWVLTDSWGFPVSHTLAPANTLAEDHPFQKPGLFHHIANEGRSDQSCAQHSATFFVLLLQKQARTCFHYLARVRGAPVKDTNRKLKQIQ